MTARPTRSKSPCWTPLKALTCALVALGGAPAWAAARGQSSSPVRRAGPDDRWTPDWVPQNVLFGQLRTEHEVIHHIPNNAHRQMMGPDGPVTVISSVKHAEVMPIACGNKQRVFALRYDAEVTTHFTALGTSQAQMLQQVKIYATALGIFSGRAYDSRSAAFFEANLALRNANTTSVMRNHFVPRGRGRDFEVMVKTHLALDGRGKLSVDFSLEPAKCPEDLAAEPATAVEEN